MAASAARLAAAASAGPSVKKPFRRSTSLPYSSSLIFAACSPRLSKAANWTVRTRSLRPSLSTWSAVASSLACAAALPRRTSAARALIFTRTAACACSGLGLAARIFSQASACAVARRLWSSATAGRRLDEGWIAFKPSMYFCSSSIVPSGTWKGFRWAALPACGAAAAASLRPSAIANAQGPRKKMSGIVENRGDMRVAFLAGNCDSFSPDGRE